MGDTVGRAFSEIMVLLGAVVSLAVVAVLVSKNAQTGSVLTAGGGAFSNILSAAVSPVTGNIAGGGFSSF
jgi:PRD1 phage membrane DNA delivery